MPPAAWSPTPEPDSREQRSRGNPAPPQRDDGLHSMSMLPAQQLLDQTECSKLLKAIRCLLNPTLLSDSLSPPSPNSRGL